MLYDVVKIGILTESENITKSIGGYLIAINLNEDYSFNSIDIEQFQEKLIGRYLYREDATKGNKTAPIAPLTEPEKTFEKISRWFNTANEQKELSLNEKSVLQNIVKTLETNKENLITSIGQKSKEIPKKESKFLTIKLQDKYLGDDEVIRKVYQIIEKNKPKKSATKDQVCSICGQTKENISARTNVYNFDTDDKPGFITGFNQENYWKNIPVCDECRALMKKGRDFIDNKLTFKFYGLKYQLIIKSLSENDEVLREIIDILKDSQKIISLKNNVIKKITNDENEILEFFTEKADSIALNLLFLQTQQSAERILLLIEDVLPSRLRKIFEAKSYVDKLYETQREDQKNHFVFTFGKIRTFFSKSDEGKRNYDLDKYFLEIVDAVFLGKKIDFSFLAKFYMQVIRREFANDGYYLFRINDAMMCTSFFEKLQLIDFEEVHMEKSLFEEFFTKYGKSFSKPERRGIFLLGILTQMLLNKQYTERSSKPFMKKLKNLKMNEIDIKGLLAEVQNKLEEYDSFDKGKRQIAEEASKYLLEAGDNWKMSVDEINYYFACGLNLADKIAEIVYAKQK